MMLTHLDHGLSSHGCDEALQLWDDICTMPEKVGELAASGASAAQVQHQLESWRRFLDASKVIASPMTRAVQTAMIALHGHPSVRKRGIHLMSTVREIKNSIGSLDCVGVASGTAIRFRALDNFKAHQDAVSPPSSPTTLSRKRASRIQLDDLMLDTIAVVCNDCERGQWWTSRQDHDRDSDVLQRMRDFMRGLMFMPESDVILVSHSNFLMSLIRHFASKRCRSDGSNAYRSLATSKIQNCGVVQLDFDFSSGLLHDGEGPIVDARLLFGSRVEARKNSTER